MSEFYPVKKALISVSDKSGLNELCDALSRAGVELFSTGGTAVHLEKAGFTTVAVESVTQFPEMMDGRVKTLHPRIFGGVLARRDVASDLDEAHSHAIPIFDLVVVNLYPFQEYLDADETKQAAHVDIGGPSLIRAASKNHKAVVVLSDPADYASFIEEFETNAGKTSLAFRKAAAVRSFARTSAYDAMISNAWAAPATLPTSLSLSPQQSLRYGENPHQQAVWCGTAKWKLLQGKELSYNNLLDLEAAWRIAAEHSQPAVAIVKHNNPCGVAAGNRPVADIFASALACDSKSAFGGIIATTQIIDKAAAEAMTELFAEAVIATGYAPQALEVFAKKKNLRVLEWPNPTAASFEIRPSLGGWLLQTSDVSIAAESKEWTTVTKQTVPDAILDDLTFAWRVAKHVRSNAIVLAKQQATIGIGAGQMSRVDAVEIALRKCGGSLAGAVLASDAFFPFRDNIDLLKGREIAAVIQPGGSKRDAEVIDACNEHGIAMIFTGTRHFKH